MDSVEIAVLIPLAILIIAVLGWAAFAKRVTWIPLALLAVFCAVEALIAAIGGYLSWVVVGASAFGLVIAIRVLLAARQTERRRGQGPEPE